jgi:flavin reductase (DIM6/NTAB) family NADH-FMN oxidoreductase RutF
MHYFADDLSRDVAARLWSAAIAPRPVFLIASSSPESIRNIAPYSSIALVSIMPPIISLSFGIRLGNLKNTLDNILATGHFSLNGVPSSLKDTVPESAQGLQREDDFNRLKLTSRKFKVSPSPAIAESLVSIACELSQLIEIDGSLCQLVLARCTELLFDDSAADGAFFDPAKSDLIASIGDDHYTTVNGKTFSLPRARE